MEQRGRNSRQREKREPKRWRERGREKKTEHPYVFISPTLEIRLGRIDAGEWSAAASLEPVLINPGLPPFLILAVQRDAKNP